MVIDEYTWPDCFPEGVPPEDSVRAGGLVYRIVKNIPPTSDDFLCWLQDNPTKTISDTVAPEKPYGVSLCTTEKRAKKLKRNFQGREQFGTSYVVKGVLDPSLGVTEPKADRKGHLTYWRAVDTAPHEYINERVQ